MSALRTSLSREKPTFSGISRVLFQTGCSSEQAVDEPIGSAAAAVSNQPFAVDPVAAAVRILDAVVIKQPRRRGLPPPFRRDSLRPLHARDVMNRAPPHEPPRHAFRGGIDDVDCLGPVEQALRPLVSLPIAAQQGGTYCTHPPAR